MMPTATTLEGRWARVKAVVAAALVEAPDGRGALVEQLCAGDETLKAEVDSLLQAHAAASPSFLEQPPIADPDDAARDANIGRTLGPYVIDDAIARGGMGTVYVASRADQEFERRVAIKMIRRGMDSDAVIRRFRIERQVLATLEHPNIASLFDGGTTPEGLPYFVMEYVAGTAIDRYADQHRLSTAARIELCLPIFDAVQHAHDRHVVHRDIKPGNVLVTADGRPKLLDFGIAKILAQDVDLAATLTAAAAPMTPQYASPEQLRGEPITPATDVYALGLLLYELLTGHRPFQGVTRTPQERARLVTEQEPSRPSTIINRVDSVTLDDGTTANVTSDVVASTRDGSAAALRRCLAGTVDEILLKALRREPHQRYASVALFAEDLRRYLAEQPTRIVWDARRYRAGRFARRYRAAIAIAAVIGAALSATVATMRQRAAVDAPALVAHSGPRPSAAVARFRNLSGRGDDEWLATAMAEMLTTELGGDGQLRIVPPERVSRVEREIGSGGDPSAVDSAQRIRAAVMSDYVVAGTVAISNGQAPRAVRIDVRVDRSGRDPIALAATGNEAQLFTLVAEISGRLRAALGMRESSPQAARGVRALLPQTLEATKLYAEGMARLRVLDAVNARALLEQAAAREPANPTIQMALASAWTALGYDGRAAAAAQRAFDASAGLNREDRLQVEGRLYEARRQWPKAVDVYRTLWAFDSGNIEYGLRLTAAQRSAGQAKDALTTIDALRQLREPENQDPRIDLEAAQAWEGLGDFPRESAAIQQALQHAERGGSRLLVARARLLEGHAYYNRGQLDAAEQALDRAQQMLLEVGDRAGAASALDNLAVVLSDKQDITRAEQMHRQALVVSEEIGDRRGMSSSLNNLGILLKDQRRFDEARRAHERSLALRREMADQNLIATSLGNLGVVFFEEDRLGEAAEYYRQSLAIYRQTGDRRGEVRAAHNLAIIDQELGHPAAARKGFEDSLATRAVIGDRRGSVIARLELGGVELAQGDLAAARQTEADAAALAGELKFKSGHAEALSNLGRIALMSGDVAGAGRFHEQALAIRRELKETRTVLESRLALAAVALEDGRAQDAERAARDLENELGGEADRVLRIRAAILLARARLTTGDVDGAARAAAVARPLAAATERVEPRHQLALVEADLQAAQGQRTAARQRLQTLERSAAAAGLTLTTLECRAALLRLDAAERRPTLREDAAILEKEVRARGAGLILRHMPAI
jgi:tetratricopeptide (TPR) repeat protein/tRNA A-37 threonylcarbamoyl transferase component Bud32